MGLEQAFIQQILPDCPEPDKLTSFIDDQYLVYCIIDNLIAEKSTIAMVAEQNTNTSFVRNVKFFLASAYLLKSLNMSFICIITIY